MRNLDELMKKNRKRGKVGDSIHANDVYGFYKFLLSFQNSGSL